MHQDRVRGGQEPVSVRRVIRHAAESEKYRNKAVNSLKRKERRLAEARLADAGREQKVTPQKPIENK
jgi:hypothetical protein